MKAVTPATEWGRRAESLYDDRYARTYRRHDDEIVDADAYLVFARWLRETTDAFPHPIDVLDLGCGTGRFFSALSNVRSLVGIDVSSPMLEQARNPIGGSGATVELVRGDFLTHEFGAARFDFVYSVGVLAEHTPLDEDLVRRVARWLKAGGRFAFTTVHPQSPSVPKTTGRRAGTLAAAIAIGGVRRRLRERLMSGGLYADELRIRELLERDFIIESLRRFTSEAHLHVLCVARGRTLP